MSKLTGEPVLVSGSAATLRPGSTLLGRLLAPYRPAPAMPAMVEGKARRRALAAWRWRMFIGFFVGYAVLYFCRKNISNALPVMATDLGYSNVQLGIIGTSLYVTYGLGKFLNGVLADRSNIRVFMATGLIVSGMLNVLFGSVPSIAQLLVGWSANSPWPWLGTIQSLVFGPVGMIWLLALCWGANGWFQSMGFPPIARGMTIWYPPKGKATRWAFWTCSHQAGTAMVMALTAWILVWGGWRACFWLPGLFCTGIGVMLLWLLADTPESKGFSSAQAFGEPATKATADEAPGEYRRAFIRHVLLNRNVWVIGLIDLCVYVVRFGTLDWATKFMVEGKGYAVGEAGLRASIMPLAGVVGVLVSGFVADALFRTRYRMVNLVSLLALAGCIWGFGQSGAGQPMLDLLLLAGIGFFVEGPQSILGGVGAVDAGGSARVASSAAGLVGILAYTGASLSGIGTGWFIDNQGWSGAFLFWIACALLGALLCAVAWREPPASPRRA